MKNGFALLLAVILSGTLLMLGAFLFRIVYNSWAGSSLLIQREVAFWLAEGGLEKGKANLSQNPDWYTDLPHLPENDLQWLRAGAVGESETLGKGRFKLVREKGMNFLYALATSGQGTAALKLQFSLFPYKTLNWEEI